MKVLITGANGFVGRWLVKTLTDAKHSVIATDLDEPQTLEGTSQTAALDITDPISVTAIMREEQPDACIHLAALAFVPDGENNPSSMMNINLNGTLNILTAMRNESPLTRLLFISTSQVYGNVSGQVTETTPPRPTTLYGISKTAAELTVLGFCKACGTDAIIARPTNHTGPGQPAQYVIPAFARQIKQAATEGASSAPMRVGNLESERAIMDVRDVAKAYMALIEQGRSGEIYNICNGAPQPMSTMLDTLCDIANVKLETETDPDLWRPTDRSPELECSKILADTDWHPAYSMEQTLAGVLESV